MVWPQPYKVTNAGRSPTRVLYYQVQHLRQRETSGMLNECHGHIILNGTAYLGAVSRHRGGPDEGAIRKNFEICKSYGIAFYRDGGDKFGASVFAKKIAAEYGVDYRTPAYIIHKRDYYGGMFGKEFESMAGYRALVADALRLGADFIKTTASGLLDFTNGTVTGPALTLEELSEMIKIAHGEGCAVMVHVNGADNIKRAAEAGADSIEHGFFMSTDALRTMAHTGAVWVPTCATVANLIGIGRYDDTVLKSILNEQKTAVAGASLYGVPVACGSDSGAYFVPQGKGTLDELTILDSLMVDAGIGDCRIKEVFERKC